MTKPAYRIAIITSDGYINSLKPLAWTLEKYWMPKPDVIVGGYSEPDFELPDGFEFHSIGSQAEYPIGRWSDGLIKFLHEIDDEVIILMLEDMWLTRPVYERVVTMAYDYMCQFEYVARLDLTGDRLNAGQASLYGKMGHVDLIWSNPDSPYHLSMMPGLWRKEHLLRVLIPNETPWDVELQGTPRLSALRNEMIVLGTGSWPVKNTLAFRGGDIGKLLLHEMDPGDVDEMRALGLFKELE